MEDQRLFQIQRQRVRLSRIPMTPLQKHESRKPVQPKPIKDMTAEEYRAWSSSVSEWLWKRDSLIAAEMVKGMATPEEVRDKAMHEKACLPRADYEWRDIPKRRHRPTRPAWSGATPEYNRQKKAEQRERERSRNGQSV